MGRGKNGVFAYLRGVDTWSVVRWGMGVLCIVVGIARADYTDRGPSAASPFRILSLNAWLLPLPLGLGSKLIEERSRILPYEILELQPDLVLLQEVWSSPVRDRFIDQFLRLGYPYSVNPNDGLDSGLLILSRLPLQNVSMKRMIFEKNTHWEEDMFVRKGAVHVRAFHPSAGWINVVVTHFGAITFDSKSFAFVEDELEIQTLQMKQFVRFLDQQVSRSDDEWLVVAGDFNMNPLEWEGMGFSTRLQRSYAYLLQNTELVDTFDAPKKLQAGAVTWDPHNPNVAQGLAAFDPPQVLDYVFSRPTWRVRHKSTRLVMQNRLSVHYQAMLKLGAMPAVASDHYGLLAEFELNQTLVH